MKKMIFYISLFSLALFSCSTEEGKLSIEEQISQIENNLLPKIIIEGKEAGEFNLNDRMEHFNGPPRTIVIGPYYGSDIPQPAIAAIQVLPPEPEMDWNATNSMPRSS